MSDKNAKWIAIYVFTHVVIAGVVYRWLQREGKTEQEAKRGAHIAGAVSGLALTSILL